MHTYVPPDIKDCEFNNNRLKGDGSYYKIWTYQEASRSVGFLDQLICDAKEQFIKVNMIYRKYIKCDVKHEKLTLMNLYKNAFISYEKLTYQVKKKGVIIHNLLHGIVTFPFTIPCDGSLIVFDEDKPDKNCYIAKNNVGLLIYRQGDLSIDKWVTQTEANNDLLNTVSKFNAQARFIPEEWK